MGWECRKGSETYCVSRLFSWMICLLLIQEFTAVTGRSVVVNMRNTCCNMGDRGSTVVKVLCYKSEGRWSDPRCQWIKSFRSHYGPGVDSASNRNEYREYFLGGKGGRCVRLTNLPPSCAIVTKSGNLNFLEPSGHLQPLTEMSTRSITWG